MTWDLEQNNQTVNDVLPKSYWHTHIMMCQMVLLSPQHYCLMVTLRTQSWVGLSQYYWPGSKSVVAHR